MIETLRRRFCYFNYLFMKSNIFFINLNIFINPLVHLTHCYPPNPHWISTWALGQQRRFFLNKEQQNANIIEWNIIYVLHLQSAVRHSHTYAAFLSENPVSKPSPPELNDCPHSGHFCIWDTQMEWKWFGLAVSDSPVAFWEFFSLRSSFGKVAPPIHKYPLGTTVSGSLG